MTFTTQYNYRENITFKIITLVFLLYKKQKKKGKIESKKKGYLIYKRRIIAWASEIQKSIHLIFTTYIALALSQQ